MSAGDYEIAVFADQRDVGDADIVDLWVREGVLRHDEAHRRVAEVLLVATQGGRPAGVSTAQLRHSDQLATDVWYYRTFVARAHRQSALAITMLGRSYDVLRDRHVSGEDTRGAGVLMAVENPMLKRVQNRGLWPRTGFAFIGESPRGSHIRLRPFPGVLAPAPPA